MAKKKKRKPVSKKKKILLVFQITFYSLFYLTMCLFYIHFRFMQIEFPREDFATQIRYAAQDTIQHPLNIFPLPEGSLKLILVVTTIAGLILWRLIMEARLRRHDKNAQGQSKLMEDLDDFNMKYTDPIGKKANDGPNNCILSEEIRLSTKNWETGRNLNMLIIGGSGSGKSYRLVGPNLMQANSSYIITDPSGSLFSEYGNFLEHLGYKVKCLNLSHMDRGNHYNPFAYIHSDKDVEVLVTTLIDNTTPPDKKGGDPFWEKSETALLVALIAYLYHYTSKSCQNFSNVMKLIRCANPREDREDVQSDLDKMFLQIQEQDPDSFAVKQYRTFKQGAGKTLKSILISVATRLQAFDLSDVADLTDTDDIDLDSIGDEKTALFIIIPTAERTFNFIASMMYSQLFLRGYDYSENTAKYSQLIMDTDDQVWKTFRAESPDDSQRARMEAEKYLERAKRSKIVYNKEYRWFELRTERDELVGYRGTEELANEFLGKLRGASVVPNSKQSNHGDRLPIHLRMIMDEFANIGKVPAFVEKVSTIRKYEISVFVVLQSIQQLENMYEKEWSVIAGNCDTTVYIGGGADSKTTKWLSELLGKTTKTVMNVSYSGRGGSTSFNQTGVDLIAASDLRTMAEDEMLIIMRGLDPYLGKKYNPENHPQRSLVKGLSAEKGAYIYNAQKSGDLLKAKQDFEQVLYKTHRHVVNDSDETIVLKNEQLEQVAAEFENNEDANGTAILGENVDVRDKESGIEAMAKVTDKDSAKEALSSSMETNEDLWGPEEIIFGSAPAQAAG